MGWASVEGLSAEDIVVSLVRSLAVTRSAVVSLFLLAEGRGYVLLSCVPVLVLLRQLAVYAQGTTHC
jgi:hypothetical protein